MRIRAFVCCYNEADILPWVIRHLVSQGVEPYLLDNWSMDGTWGMDLPLAGKERYPASGPSPVYDWHGMLRRVEELAMAPEVDWIYHYDADEIRRSPWPGMTLAEAIARVDADGWSAIDHQVLLYRPIDNGYDGSQDPERYFRHFTRDHGEARNHHIKGWKNTGQRVDLASSGGHRVWFEGINVYPEKFILKHYPIRSQQHGERKVFQERNPRWSRQERFERGWHVQYNGIEQGHNFLADPCSLESDH